MSLRRIGISWQLSNSHGWGVFGLNLALNLVRNGPTSPMLLSSPMLIDAPDETMAGLAPYIEERDQLIAQIQSSGGHVVFDDAIIMHALSDQFQHQELSDQARGAHNVGFIFFENAAIQPEAIERARQWDRVLVGSSWNRNICQDTGIEGVRFVSQGIDTEHFKPIPRGDEPRQRFVVFSGGKLELRKGQDIVLEAFRRFNARHPDSLLITAWQNHWPQTSATIEESPYITSLPRVDAEGKMGIVDWAMAHGIPAGTIVDTGWVPNTWLPRLLGQADVALFPNRGEGGTNLAAMEAMACGVPCILSANTGHLDLIGEDNCYVLYDQKPGDFTGDPARHWRESSVDEILEHLESAYQDADERKRRGDKGKEFMKGLSWKNQVEKIVTAVEDFL